MDKTTLKMLNQRKLLKMGDLLECHLISSRKKNLRLDRTRVEFATIGLFSKEVCKNIILDTLQAEKLAFVMEYRMTSDDEGYFVLKSINHVPFKINGQYCYEAIIEVGDQVWMGHNHFNFLSAHEYKIKNTTKKDNYNLTDKMLRSHLPFLIQGETGIGKTTLAREIHKKSGVIGNFVHVNLSSFAPTLIESELFGHAKGAFTGAIKSSSGALIMANSGTLFLDEIDSLPLELQSKLLLFLDNGLVRPVGDTRERQIKFRLIVASGQRLVDLVEQGLFRKDFYYRLSSGFCIDLTPLRKDHKKIEEIIVHYCSQYDLSPCSRLISFYQRMPWPGNIRQLLSHLERKRICSKSKKLDIDDMDYELQTIRKSSKEAVEFSTLADIKREYAKQIFFKLDNCVEAAAKVLDITPKTLRLLVA
jgi:DNA-binding NtrC family response regulator